jgi:hypothetical protein
MSQQPSHGSSSVERQNPLSVLKLLSSAPSLAYLGEFHIMDQISQLDKHLRASFHKKSGGKAIRAQLLEEQQATFAMAAAAAKAMQLVGQAGPAGVLSANPFGLGSVARLCSNTSRWADIWRSDDAAACVKVQRHMTITGGHSSAPDSSLPGHWTALRALLAVPAVTLQLLQPAQSILHMHSCSRVVE